tara:strand:+ start:389 stop:580 length:192 start_codon:yes stop_codon:yes gene_type:complete
MATLVKVSAKEVQCGDTLYVRNKSFIVKYIDGPDRIGTYDFHVIDAVGNSHIEILEGLVTISL